MSEIRGHILMVLISFVVIFLLVQAASFSLASAHYYSAQSHLQQWIHEGTIKSELDYEQALVSAEKALKLQPSLALYSDTLSEIIQWGAYSLPTSESDRKEKLRTALNLTLNSLRLRPSWAVSWVNAAYIKWQLGEIDDEFFTFLEKSNKLGRNSHEVNLFYLEFGFSLIDSDLDTYLAHRVEVERRLKLALSTGLTRQRALEIIDKYKKGNLVCSIFDTRALGVHSRFCG